MLPEWQYILHDENGDSYTVDDSGSVVLVTTQTPLQYTPDVWQDISLAWERDMKKVGMSRTFSISLGFVEDGAKILKRIIYTENIEKVVKQLIRKLDLTLGSTTFDFNYNPFYDGEADLSTFKDSDTKVNVSIAEGGIAKKVKSSEGTAVSLPLSADPQAVIVKMDGLYIYETKNYILPDGIELSDTVYFKPALPISEISSDGSSTGVASFSQQLEDTNNDVTYANTSDNDFFEVTNISIGSVTVLLVGTVRFKCLVNTNGGVFNTNFRTNKGQNFQVTSGVLTVGQAYALPYNQSIVLAPGEKLFMFGQIGSISNPSSQETKIVFLPDSNFSLSYKTKYKTTYVRALRPMRVFGKLTENATGDITNALSTLLPVHNNLVLTSGDSLRSLPGTVLKTSLNAFSDFCRVVLAAGIGIENNSLVIENYTHFLDYSNPIDLGEAKDLTVSLAADIMGNTIKAGYNVQNIDDVNGKYSFNNTSLYSSPITRIVKEISFISPYLADPYVIETYRINKEGETTTDDKNDNEVFVLNINDNPISFGAPDLTANFQFGIPGLPTERQFLFTSNTHIEDFQPGGRFTITGAGIYNQDYNILSVTPTGTDSFKVVVDDLPAVGTVTGATITTNIYTLRRPAYTSLTGVPDTVNMFNIAELTPARIVKKQSSWLNSIFNGFSGQILKFESTDKNAELATNLSAESIVEEKANVTIANTPKLFLPFYFDFETEVPYDLFNTLAATPNRCFSFKWKGHTFKGFLIKAGLAPNTEASQSYKLLSSPDNDLSLLL